ncbi:MAG: hypothetical protein ACRDHW_00230 [Ktedonobacteraceae bacterium]
MDTERFDPRRHTLDYAAQRLAHFAEESRTPALTEERLREIVAETIKSVLYPARDGVVTHQHMRVRQWDEHGVEWRGVLYKVEAE